MFFHLQVIDGGKIILSKSKVYDIILSVAFSESVFFNGEVAEWLKAAGC